MSSSTIAAAKRYKTPEEAREESLRLLSEGKQPGGKYETGQKAVSPSTAGSVSSAVQHALEATPALAPFVQAGGILKDAGEAVGGGAASAAESVVGAVTGAAGDAGQAVAEGAIEFVRPDLEKLTLYAVLIFGAMAMMIFGLSELLKPVGGPDIRNAIAHAGEAGEVAAA